MGWCGGGVGGGSEALAARRGGADVWGMLLRDAVTARVDELQAVIE